MLQQLIADAKAMEAEVRQRLGDSLATCLNVD